MLYDILRTLRGLSAVSRVGLELETSLEVGARARLYAVFAERTHARSYA